MAESTVLFPPLGSLARNPRQADLSEDRSARDTRRPPRRSSSRDRRWARLRPRKRRGVFLQPRPIPMETERLLVRRHFAQLWQPGDKGAPRSADRRAAPDRDPSTFLAAFANQPPRGTSRTLAPPGLLEGGLRVWTVAPVKST